MFIKELYGNVTSRIADGAKRFPAAILGLAAITVCLILSEENYGWRDDLAKAIGGIGWGVAASIAGRIVAERLSLGRSVAALLHAAAFAVVGALGCFFWFSVLEESRRYLIWVMVYWGFLIAMTSLAAHFLYDRKNERSLAPRIIENALFTAATTLLLSLATMLCFWAFDELITHVSASRYGDAWIFYWTFAAPVAVLSFLPRRGEVERPSKLFDILFAILLPCALALLAILYLYILKIILSGTMPSGTMNGFASLALAGYLVLWISTRDSSVAFVRKFMKWAWMLLIPVIIVQIVGIVIRYNAYGLTSWRMAGMITLGIGIYALAVAALGKSPKSIFAVIAAAGIFFTVSPWNVIDVPLKNQIALLKSAFERHSIIEKGKEAGKGIPEEEQKSIVSSWEYVTEWKRSGGGSRSDRLCSTDCAREREPRRGVYITSDAFVENLSTTLGEKTLFTAYGISGWRGDRSRDRDNYSAQLTKNSVTKIPEGFDSFHIDNWDAMIVFDKDGTTRINYCVGKPGEETEKTRTIVDVSENIKAILSNLKDKSDYRIYYGPELAWWKIDDNKMLFVQDVEIWADRSATHSVRFERWGFNGILFERTGDAAQGRFPWSGKISEELMREYVTPDRVIDEEIDAWRPVFTRIFTPIVADAKTPTEAVQKINAVIWDKLDVHYSTKRDKANQSPFHSMRIHMASCTGMAILQICAYRSVGIPARLVGCNWTTIPGNHSWPEFWDNGWHFFGDGNPSPIDNSWVAPFAAEADASNPATRIYASRATPGGTWFWRTWAWPQGFSNVPADDITESYRKYKKEKLSNDDVPLDTNYVHPSKR